MVPDQPAKRLFVSVRGRCFSESCRNQWSELVVAEALERACLTERSSGGRATTANSKLQERLFCGGFAESRGAFSCVLLQRCALRSELGLKSCNDSGCCNGSNG